jgi:CBS domain containing-hemolysin-like protein
VIWLALALLFTAGIFLSAFFSGSETGLYRATKVRLALDALGGDRVSRSLLWLTNNPTLFVATSLIGNNIANYVTSLAIVLGTRQLGVDSSHLAELLAPIIFAPVVFVYGELLPKHLFYVAPNRLLRFGGPLFLLCVVGGPLFLLCVVLFAPVSAVLWTLGRFLQWIVGEAPEFVRSRLAREELQRILVEGHEAGVLRPAQRQLAQGMFAVANDPVFRFCVPVGRTTSVPRTASRTEVLRIARRQRTPVVIVLAERSRRLVGYVRIVDIHLSGKEWGQSLRPLLRIHYTDSHIATLTRMQTEREPIAEVFDDQGATLGIVSIQKLVQPLLRD